jgi:hypothetical protein
MYDVEDGISVADILAAVESCGSEALSYRHASGYHFIKKLQHHKWRTHDKNAAKLFVIPIVPGVAVRTQKARGGSGLKFFSFSGPKVRCDYDEAAVQKTIKLVKRTTSWRKHGGEDHVACGTDYAVAPAAAWAAKVAGKEFLGKKGYLQFLRKKIYFATYEAVSAHQVSAPYMSSHDTADAYPTEPYTWLDRPTRFFFGGNTW